MRPGEDTRPVIPRCSSLTPVGVPWGGPQRATCDAGRFRLTGELHRKLRAQQRQRQNEARVAAIRRRAEVHKLRQAHGEEGADPFAGFERPPTPLRLQVDREKAAWAARQGAAPTASSQLPPPAPTSGGAAAPSGKEAPPSAEARQRQRRHRQRVLEWTDDSSQRGAMELHKELRAAKRMVGLARETTRPGPVHPSRHRSGPQRWWRRKDVGSGGPRARRGGEEGAAQAAARTCGEEAAAADRSVARGSLQPCGRGGGVHFTHSPCSPPAVHRRWRSGRRESSPVARRP